MLLIYTQQNHNDVHTNHTSITTEDFQTQKSKFEVRQCGKHKDQPVTLGCEKCLKLACVQCLSEHGGCADSK